jgi:hypothetical protein
MNKIILILLICFTACASARTEGIIKVYKSKAKAITTGNGNKDKNIAVAYIVLHYDAAGSIISSDRISFGKNTNGLWKITISEDYITHEAAGAKSIDTEFIHEAELGESFLLTGKLVTSKLGVDLNGDALLGKVAKSLKGSYISHNEELDVLDNQIETVTIQWSLDSALTKESNNYHSKKVMHNAQKMPEVNDVIEYIKEVRLAKYTEK